MTTFKEKLDERMAEVPSLFQREYTRTEKHTARVFFEEGARAALLLAADESEALSERMIAQRLRDRAKEIE